MSIAQALVRAGLPDSARAVTLGARRGADVDPVRQLAWAEAIVRTWLGEYDEALRQLGIFLAGSLAFASWWGRPEAELVGPGFEASHP
jgi:hypothetical protein